MTYGPADLYVVEFPRGIEPTLVTATLRDVSTAGVITLLDLALVRRADDGSREVFELDEFADDFGLAGVVPAAPDLIGEDDILGLTEDLAPGATALVVLLENSWARKLTQSVMASKATVRPVERFPAEVVNAVAAELAGTK